MLCPKKFKVFHTNYKEIVTKWVSMGFIRMKTSSKSKTNLYSHTIILPKTDFPARPKKSSRDEIQKSARFSELYNWQREHLQGDEFVLHDGPPYANGDLHMGHAVNKIIKDITNRSWVLRGNKVHYVPGWDCHGLPIELKALQEANKFSSYEVTHPLEIRQIARAFALETVKQQKEKFKSWGIMADWDEQCYKTLDNHYIMRQLDTFYKMYEAGLIYRALKPVYWSPSSKTALAEAELEYDPYYKSTEAYVSFPLEEVPEAMKNAVNGEPLSVIIWTTTPWTLAANRAVCFHPALRYSVVRVAALPGCFLVAAPAAERLQLALARAVVKIADFDGSELFGARYHNELLDLWCPLLAGAHVAADRGTGLVHTAPAHGPEDFLVGVENNIPVECNVDECGRYCNVHPNLDGLYVLGEGQEAVLAALGAAVLRRGVHAHAYPLDWRTKGPVILRASHQWFVDTDALKARALKALDDVNILPAATAAQTREGFRARILARPYWCVSRQRAWGVPLPALLHPGGAIVHKRILERLYDLLESHGPDAWWTCSVQDLLPEDLAQELNVNINEVTKGQDIMDIWLDSGTSWRSLETAPAALYSEGVDQLTGWFQSSLLTAVAVADRAPFECIFVHGFVVDKDKKKMSKSLGNVISPDTIIHGDKTHPAYGIDTLRWWVASHGTQHSQIVISTQILEDCRAEVARLRGILRLLLGALFEPPRDFSVAPPLNYLDRYMLAETYRFLRDVAHSTRQLRFNQTVRSVLHFVSNKVSALYCHCVKDRLYCEPRESKARVSAQLVAHTVLVALCEAVGPVLPHLVEEAWQHHPLHREPYFFTRDIPVLAEEPVDTGKMDVILDLKKDVCALINNENLKRYTVDVKLNPTLFNSLNELNSGDDLNASVLCEILEVSGVSLKVDDDVGKWQVCVAESARAQCLRCRKYTALPEGDKCLRCDQAIKAKDSSVNK